MRKILFIINSKAGKTEFDIKKEDIEKTFMKAGRLDEIEVVIFFVIIFVSWVNFC